MTIFQLPFDVSLIMSGGCVTAKPFLFKYQACQTPTSMVQQHYLE